MAATPPLTGLHDIFYHILWYLTPDSPEALKTGCVREGAIDSKAVRKALACLARTHSSFTQPALAVMWRSIPSEEALEHLLCLVGIARRPSEQLWGTPPLEMCGTPETHESGWIRFREYASLVQDITIDPFVSRLNSGRHAKLMEGTFWCQLSSAFGDTPILPRLKGVIFRSLNHHCSVNLDVLRLLNPSISKLEVIYPLAKEEDLKRLKSALTGFLSSIENLEVLLVEVSNLGMVLDAESLPHLYPHLRYLKQMSYGCLSMVLSPLLPLASLPELEHLTICLDSWELPNLQITFARLCSLALSSDDFSEIVALLDHIDAPRLRTYSISETHQDSEIMSRELPNHLCTLIVKCSSLTAFSWTSGQARVWRVGFLGQRRFSAPLAELVAPLLSHRAMRSFSAAFNGTIVQYTPADFHTFAAAWPDLESFRIYDDVGHYAQAESEQYADLKSIVAFARHCSALRSLRIVRVRLDLESESDALVGWERRPSPHWLGELFVAYVVVVCSGEGSKENLSDRRQACVARFRGLMEEVFPSAVIRIRY